MCTYRQGKMVQLMKQIILVKYFVKYFLKNICDKYVGHGVGSFLNVHEGPFGIGGGHNSQDPGLRENFFTSNGIKINFKQFTGIFSLSSRNNYHTCSSI